MRQASTIILAARNNIIGTTGDYSLLLVKRSSKNRFMPSTHVFPGGVVEVSDEDPRWAELCGWRGDTDELTFRIAAIRELFEEVNVLLSSKDIFTNTNNDELQLWRKDVQNDSSKFYEMCNHYKFYPKVDMLYKWAHWITPVFEIYRYDTNFYVSMLPSIPNTTLDNTEVTHMSWLTPQQALTTFSKGDIILPPPTWVTVNQLATSTTFDSLSKLCEIKTKTVLSPWLPVLESELPHAQQHTKQPEEGLVLILPGDERYPNGPTNKGITHCMIISPHNTYKYINGPTTLHSKL